MCALKLFIISMSQFFLREPRWVLHLTKEAEKGFSASFCMHHDQRFARRLFLCCRSRFFVFFYFLLNCVVCNKFFSPTSLIYFSRGGETERPWGSWGSPKSFMCMQQASRPHLALRTVLNTSGGGEKKEKTWNFNRSPMWNGKTIMEIFDWARNLQKWKFFTEKKKNAG